MCGTKINTSGNPKWEICETLGKSHERVSLSASPNYACFISLAELHTLRSQPLQLRDSFCMTARATTNKNTARRSFPTKLRCMAADHTKLSCRAALMVSEGAMSTASSHSNRAQGKPRGDISLSARNYGFLRTSTVSCHHLQLQTVSDFRDEAKLPERCQMSDTSLLGLGLSPLRLNPCRPPESRDRKARVAESPHRAGDVLCAVGAQLRMLEVLHFSDL